MVPIAIRDELIRSVEKLAQDQGTDAESLVNAWIERELASLAEQPQSTRPNSDGDPAAVRIA